MNGTSTHAPPLSRCWVFDWKIGGHTLWDNPGRRRAMDDPNGSNAVLVYTSPGSRGPLSEFLIGSAQAPHDDADILQAIESRFPGAEVARATKNSGEQHPRIWRGPWSRLPNSEVESFTGAVNSAHLLIARFRQVALTVEPHKDNRAAFGHELRHLLILAATEVESAWKAILVANNFPRPAKDHCTTRDYFTLIDPLRLREWSLILAMYPGYGVISPFQTWDREHTTASLPWYEAYNHTKHDRESNLKEATLENVIMALAALYVMLCAQFGPARLRQDPFSIHEFAVEAEPQWALEEEYVPVVSREVEPKLVPLYPVAPGS